MKQCTCFKNVVIVCNIIKGIQSYLWVQIPIYIMYQDTWYMKKAIIGHCLAVNHVHCTCLFHFYLLLQAASAAPTTRRWLGLLFCVWWCLWCWWCLSCWWLRLRRFGQFCGTLSVMWWRSLCLVAEDSNLKKNVE